MSEDEFVALVNESMEYMHQAIDACNREWDFQSYGNWQLSLDRRVLTFSDGPKPPIECDIQVAGIYMTNRNIWRWSWENPSIELALRTELEAVRSFGQEHDVRAITLGSWEAEDEEAAWAMTALAAKLLQAKSVYRAPDEPRHVFLLITAVRWASEGAGGN
jgi:hypothetical protein